MERLAEAGDDPERIRVDDALAASGSTSFAPPIVLAGLVMLAPLVGDIPGVPVLMGLVVILLAAQLLARRERPWLPAWLRRRSVERRKLQSTLRAVRPVARFLDRLSRPRLTALVDHGGGPVIAVACIAVATATPLMEVIPFSAALAGAAITAFGLSLIVRDGLLALVGIACSGAVLAIVGVAFL